MKDKLFQKKEPPKSGSFVFDQRVVAVFDDMVSRSVPGYQTIQLLVADLADRYAKDGTIFDLGCSTGATIKAISHRARKRHAIIGIDNSEEMVAKCRAELGKIKNCDVKIQVGDITAPDLFGASAADVVILNLTLQFVRPPLRKGIIERCYDALSKGGALILVEKTVETDPVLNSLFIDYYHSFKGEMGYTEMEIAAKREALENVLVPYRKEENNALLTDAGFTSVGTFFQWFNFAGFLAIK